MFAKNYLGLLYFLFQVGNGRWRNFLEMFYRFETLETDINSARMPGVKILMRGHYMPTHRFNLPGSTLGIILGIFSLLLPCWARDGKPNTMPRRTKESQAKTAARVQAPAAPEVTFGCSGSSTYVKGMGTVSVGCPKVWRSDRVFSVLDGIMRDVDSMTIRALEGLDANAANQAAIDLIQNSFDLTAKFDQAAAINNGFALEKLKTARANEVAAFKADADFRQKLIQRRNDLTLQLLDAQAKERQQLQNGANPTDIQTTKNIEGALQDQIKGINDTLNTTPPSISDAQLASTASTTINDADRPQHATLDKLPQSFQDALTNLIKQPTFPPAIAMDNVIDLLHQRIAREFAVIYDDLMRDSDRYDVYLVQFDTSINPEPNARDRGVHVELSFTGCSENSATDFPLAYELYPSAAAYNIMHGFNQTTHTGITGMAQTIVGWGLQASFQHDHSSLRSGLSQSIYASGFGAGQRTFGWDFAPAPYENRLAPGLRTTYAVLRVPKGCKETVQTSLSVEWPKRDRRYAGWNPLHWFRSSERNQAGDGLQIAFPRHHALQVAHVSYVPADIGEKGSEENSPAKSPGTPDKAASPTPASGGTSNPASPSPTPAQAAKPAVIQVRFRNSVDPNLIVTANDQILRRVRDVRGRGLYTDSTTTLHLAGNTAETNALSTSRFGLLESDIVGEDTWFQADSHTILLYVGRQTAGTDHFPIIRIIDPSSGGGSEITALARDADEVRVGEWFFTQPDTLSAGSFQPVFTKPYYPGRFSVYIQTVTPGNGRLQGLDLRLVSYATVRNTRRPIYLHDQAQVVLEAKTKDGEPRFALPFEVSYDLATRDQALQLMPNWAMECGQDRGALVCSAPLREMRAFCGAAQTKEDALALKKNQPDKVTKQTAPNDLSCLTNFKIWLDQAPYYGRPGMWGDADLKVGSSVSPLETLQLANEDVITRGRFEIREEKLDATQPSLGYAWVITLELINPQGHYEIPEFADMREKLTARLSAGLAHQSATVKDPNQQAGNIVEKYFKAAEDHCAANGASDSPFEVITTSQGICIVVPYAFFSAVPQTIHLQRPGNLVSRIELPGLRDQLVPHDLTLVPLGKNVFQLQGDNVRAVDQILLSAKNNSCLIDQISKSYNVIEFQAPCAKPGLDYTIQLGLGEGKINDAFVDLYKVDERGTQVQQVLSVAPPDK
jgi:hypothetical protein